MTVPDRIAVLSQRITALTGQSLSRDDVMTVVGRAFEHQVDLDDDGQLRALLGGLASSASSGGPAAPTPRRAAITPSPSAPFAPSPSGAAAKAAAVLALLGGIANLGLGGVLAAAGGYVSDHDTVPGWYHATIYAVVVCGVIVAGALLAGGVMTFRRRRLGPQIVAAGCALCIAVFFGDLAMTVAAADQGGVGVGGSPGRYLSGLIFPVVTLVLALLPSTRQSMADHAPVAPSDRGSSRTNRSGITRGVGIVLVGASVVGAAVLAVNHFGRTDSTAKSTTATRADYRQVELPFTFGKFFSNPHGIAVDAAGNVYVGGDQGVLKLAPGAAAPDKLPFPERRTSADIGHVDVYGVAVDTAGNVYATYATDNRVLKLAAGASAPAELPLSGLNMPFEVAADAAGNVYVSDRDNDRVLKLAVGADTPITLPFIGLKRPMGIAVDAAGNVYVGDDYGYRVLKLASDSGTTTELPFAGFTQRTGIAVDAAGSVYVAEEQAKRVLRLTAGADAPTELPFVDLKGPKAVTVDNAGNVYVIDFGGSFRIVSLSRS